MTDPNGPSRPGSNQPGSQQPGWNQGGWSTAPRAEAPETAQWPGSGPQGPPPPGWSDPHQPQQYGSPQQYAETAQYPGAAPYPGQQYPGQPYPGQQYPGGQGYPGGQQYAGLPGGWNPSHGGYGPPPASPGRGRRTGIVVAAVVASVAIVAAVVVVVLLNRAPDPNTPVAEGASTAPLVIPDNTAGGATSTITLDGGDASVGRLEVVLDLQHDYPTEVTGVLTSPAGRQAVVFPRGSTGGRLSLSTTDPASPLANLLGGPVAGDWALTLSDEVSADSGTLLSWRITAYPAAQDAPAPTAVPATASSTPAIAIPDDDVLIGATDVVELGGYGTVDRIVVDVAITHAISSDLRIELRSPLGRTVVLTEYEAGLGPAIALTLDSATPGSPLAPLVGEPLAGPWELRVYDGVIVDEGTFDRWGVTVNG